MSYMSVLISSGIYEALAPFGNHRLCGCCDHWVEYFCEEKSLGLGVCLLKPLHNNTTKRYDLCSFEEDE